MRTTDRAFGLDAGTIVAVSTAICLASRHALVMDVVVALVLGLRCALWLALPRAQRSAAWLELLLFALCLGVGAFNDWNSVTRRRVYDYAVPLEAPALSLVPLWMLLYWGMIVRFMISLLTWSRLGLEARRPRAATLAALLVLVAVTRQTIYRLYQDPLWSWLPFLAALALALVVLRPDRRRLALLGATLLLGPAVEALYIQVGHLHVYRLGWLGGVPVWIALWWVLAVLVLDALLGALALRLQPEPGRAVQQPLR
ncbi:MAG: DUF2878 family protein [Deltaproteobacteria bacterium]|nr:DUF2878 family protein [Deltaproteobacteria bacterium]